MTAAQLEQKYEWDKFRDALHTRLLARGYEERREALAAFWICRFLRWCNE